MTKRKARLPEPMSSTLSQPQRRARDEVLSGPRGGFGGPFGVLLRCPELMVRIQAVGEQLRFGTGQLAPDVREIAILCVARFWDQDFEWQHHEPLARSAGVSETTIDAIARSSDPTEASPAQRSAYEMVTELLRTRGLSDATYEAALEEFDESGIVELTSLAGYYTTLAMIMNVAQTVAPGSETLPAISRTSGHA